MIMPCLSLLSLFAIKFFVFSSFIGSPIPGKAFITFIIVTYEFIIIYTHKSADQVIFRSITSFSSPCFLRILSATLNYNHTYFQKILITQMLPSDSKNTTCFFPLSFQLSNQHLLIYVGEKRRQAK